MEVIVQKLLMNLLIWVLRMLNGIMDIFQQLAGVKSVDSEGNDLITLFLNNEGITKVFFGIFIISIVVVAISIIVAIVKGFVNMSGQERKPISKITGQGVGSVFISLLMAGIMVTGITIANSLLRDVNAAFGIENQNEVCNDLFDIAVDDGAFEMVPDIEYEKWVNPITLEEEFKTDSNGEKIPVYLTDSEGNVMKDDSGNPIPKVNGYIKTPVYEKDSEGNYILDANGDKIPVEGGWTSKGKKAKENTDWSILDENADTILGDYSKDFPYVFPNPSKVAQEGLIYWGSFNFILGYFAAIIVLVAVASACLGLVKRLYDLVVLFLSLPLIASTIPLDNGARFKVWRETVISKVILAYGAVFAVNTFIIMAPIITSLQITKIIKMILIVGGGLSISGGMLLFARIFGTDAAESREMAQSARTLLAGSKAAVAGVAGTALKAGSIAGGAGKIGFKGFGAVGGFLGNRLLPADLGGSAPVSSSVAHAASAALTPQASPGSKISQIMENAGIVKNNSFRDKTTGRFVSHSQVADLIDKGLSKESK